MTRRKHTTRADGSKVYGPYKGSKANGGRKHYVIKKGGKTTSKNQAKQDLEDRTGRKLGKHVHADHKDGNKHNNSAKNVRAMSAKDNVGKGNKERKPAARKAAAKKAASTRRRSRS